MSAPAFVLDASALLAWLQGEPGTPIVRAALNDQAVISVVNWAEVLTKLADLGHDPEQVLITMGRGGVLGNNLLLWSMDAELALDVAKLRTATRQLGLSLADRACIALGQRLRLPILTTDRAWKTLRLPVRIQVIR